MMSRCHWDITKTSDGGDVLHEEDVRDMELILSLPESPLFETSSPVQLRGWGMKRVDEKDQDRNLQGCEQLERRWVLWHEFMEEHAHLDMWLRLAEQAVNSHNSSPVTYITAKENLRTFERLRCEAGSRLKQLDSLTQQNRTLTQLFLGAMQAQLLASVRESGRRWDDVNAKLESIRAQLKAFVSEWEGFEAEREELFFGLADLDVRLTEVDHLTGSTCKKLRRLQSFQQHVCENSTRVNALLQRGEALIQHSEPTDAQLVESRLLDLLRRCSRVYNNIVQTHTRLLSMRLVFEDNWILSQAPDSGCPSEALLDEEGALDKSNLDLSAVSNRPKDLPSMTRYPPPPPSPASSTHEHLGLEWDPSVDIGHSVSCDDGDSSYFSASTGVCDRDGPKRWSYLSSLSSLSEITNQEADTGLGWPNQTRAEVFSTVTTLDKESQQSGDQWPTSTPDRQDSEPISFDGGQVRAWLGVQSLALPERRSSCSKAVQTDLQADLQADLQTDGEAGEEKSCCEEAELLLSKQSVSSSSGAASSSSSSSLCLYLLLAVILLACVILVTVAVLESPCHRSSRVPHNFHLTMRYVNGPPPT